MNHIIPCCIGLVRGIARFQTNRNRLFLCRIYPGKFICVYGAQHPDQLSDVLVVEHLGIFKVRSCGHLFNRHRHRALGRGYGLQLDKIRLEQQGLSTLNHPNIGKRHKAISRENEGIRPRS